MTRTFESSPDFAALLARHGLSDLDAVFAWSIGERLDKPGLETWRQRWRLRLAQDNGRDRTIYLKRFERPPLRQQVERWRRGGWRLSTAGVEWRNALDLAKAGIRAARGVAFGQEMIGTWERRSCLLLDEVAGESLERWLPCQWPPPGRDPEPRTRQRRLDRLARFVAAFHRAGFVHRDLYLSHVFVQPGEQDTVERFCLIDLQRVFRPRWRRQRWMVKDLAALDFSAPSDRVSPRERLRFLCRYVRQGGGLGSTRTLARQVAARTARTARRHKRPQAGEWKGKPEASLIADD